MPYPDSDVVKYIARCCCKDGLKDLYKCREYLDRIIRKYSMEHPDEVAMLTKNVIPFPTVRWSIAFGFRVCRSLSHGFECIAALHVSRVQNILDTSPRNSCPCLPNIAALLKCIAYIA